MVAGHVIARSVLEAQLCRQGRGRAWLTLMLLGHAEPCVATSPGASSGQEEGVLATM